MTRVSKALSKCVGISSVTVSMAGGGRPGPSGTADSDRGGPSAGRPATRTPPVAHTHSGEVRTRVEVLEPEGGNCREQTV